MLQLTICMNELAAVLKRDLAIQRSHHLELSKDVWERCQSFGIRMKLNTVVCSVNKNDTMLELVRQLRPDRWKIFEVLPVTGTKR